MPLNQKHTWTFTYEPPRIAQECVAGERGSRPRRATPPLAFLSTSRVAGLPGGRGGGGV